ncbi:MAG: DUF4398 domain-containing protein [Pseudomonadota bacterium]
MSDARLAISAAEDAGAGTLAPDALAEAKVVLRSAEQNIARRAYTAARRDAALTKELATKAREVAEAAAEKSARDQVVPIKEL